MKLGSNANATTENIEGITCKVIRSDRRSIALIVGDDARLTVRAPHYLPYRAISDFINEKKLWIAQKQCHVQEIGRKYAPILFRDGDCLPYQGKQYKIITHAATKTPYISGDAILIPEQHAKEKFISWMKNQALEAITARVAYHADVMQLCYGKIGISSARTRWGSCGAANTLNFTWRLLMCPPHVLDYVVVHELSHIPYKNHGPDFWELVEKNCPDYRLHQNWLKENRRILDII